MEYLSRYRELIVPDIFGGTPDDDNPIVEDFGEEIYSQYGAEWRCGASKMCIIPSEGDMVIKLPFTGNIYYDDEGSPYIEEFENSGSESCTWDYCLTEVELYNKVATAGFECFLARTEAYGKTHSGHPMYIQEKVNVYGDCRHKYKKDVSDNAKSKTATVLEKYRDRYMHNRRNDEMIEEDFIGYTFAETGETFLSYLIDAYSYENVAKFAKWVYENAREIAADLHWGNIGFRESDGTPCLLDFSGYYD